MVLRCTSGSTCATWRNRRHFGYGRMRRPAAGVPPVSRLRALVPARWTLSYGATTGITMGQLLFKNFQLLEPEIGELRGGFELLVEGGTVKEPSDKPIKSAGADVIDCGGRTMMPG